ncbi:MAG: hypothetical protein VYC39_03545 [Myxococcota bacterium]|nr:hypothetical protein [Myxococcota bacterium]
MNGKISKSLGGLLGKLAASEAASEGMGDLSKQGLKGKKSKATKGETLENDLLLSGLGFSQTDKKTNTKNKSETQNILRFLKDPKGEIKKLKAQKNLTKDSSTEKNSPNQADNFIRKEVQEPIKEQLAQERTQEAQQQAVEQLEPKELKEHSEAHEHALPQQEKRKEQEDSKGGNAWVLDDDDEGSTEKESGGEAQVFSNVERCHGHLEDGSRCLRKAKEGSPFCAVHH